MFRRSPPLPQHIHSAWWAFLDCAEVLEAGHRVLFGAMPTFRVEPVPITVGTEGMRRAIADARGWMPDWRIDELAEDWRACTAALDEAEAALALVESAGATSDELDDVLQGVRRVVDPLDAFAVAEQAFRRRWRCPETRPDAPEGAAHG
ncbi:MAG: hypothetical protein RLZZ272_318 [Actinomycetota bacterium]